MQFHPRIVANKIREDLHCDEMLKAEVVEGIVVQIPSNLPEPLSIIKRLQIENNQQAMISIE